MQTKQERAWLTGAHIKWIAIITMVIDHIGAAFIEPMILNGYAGYNTLYTLSWVDVILRGIGRFAFPAFCFLLVEGLFHTSNRMNYLRNLLIFTVLSEIPFDLALFDAPFHWGAQNVFLTLSAGFAAIWIAEYCMCKSLQNRDNATTYYIIMVVDILVMAGLAELLHADYGAVGVAAIFVMYAMHNKPVMGALFAWMMLSLLNFMEFFSLPFVLAIYFYNGKRGKQVKYFFYAFYPVHLLILALTKMIIL